MPMVTVSLSPEQTARIRAAVDSGAYASGSAVVREALMLWSRAERQSPSAESGAFTDGNAALSVASLFTAYRARSAGNARR